MPAADFHDLEIFDSYTQKGAPQMLIPPNTDRGAAQKLVNNHTASDSNSIMGDSMHFPVILTCFHSQNTREITLTKKMADFFSIRLSISNY
jgi:hypothetical protein